MPNSEGRLHAIWVQQVLTHESVLDQNFWLTTAGKGLRHIMELPLMTVPKGCLTTGSSGLNLSADMTPRMPMLSPVASLGEVQPNCSRQTSA